MEQYSKSRLRLGFVEGPTRAAHEAVLRLRERNQTYKAPSGVNRSAMSERNTRYACANR